MLTSIERTSQLRSVVAPAPAYLAGLERESTKINQQKMIFREVRSQPIISMYGFGCDWLFQIGVTFMLRVGPLSMTVLTAIAWIARTGARRHGSTSEVSALSTFAAGGVALPVDIRVPFFTFPSFLYHNQDIRRHEP